MISGQTLPSIERDATCRKIEGAAIDPFLKMTVLPRALGIGCVRPQ